MAAPRETVHDGHGAGQRLPKLTLAALGIVYGDIGTSPLYTLRECFSELHGVPLTNTTILGFLSLIFWALTLVVTIKYVVFIMRADNRGEGGILALMALALRSGSASTVPRRFVLALGMFGAALFYGDGMITPAISVLSAVEGLHIVTPLFSPYVVPLTIVILIGLFVIQRRGTGGIGKLFGPVMCLWFGILGVTGIGHIIQQPVVLWALNPTHAIGFLLEFQWQAFLSLGAVVLAVTGGEALYADMGHFGPLPIRLAWFGFVLPALVLNYLGQGALLIADPGAIDNPFFLMVPGWAVLPLVLVATLATVIASQAVISGAFSLSRQAVQLGFMPRLRIRHTSETEIGQIYVPKVNWWLLVAIVLLVLGFQSSTNFAAAYGVAVTGTMAITSILGYLVARHHWHWSKPLALAVMGVFLAIDLAFFSANILKFFDGGWFPLLAAVILFALMWTWMRGRAVVFKHLREESMEVAPFVARCGAKPPTRVSGTAVFLTGYADMLPHALLHNLKHNKVLHERVILLTVVTEEVPVVSLDRRFEIQDLGADFHRVLLHFGFMETPNVPEGLAAGRSKDFEFDMMDVSFFLTRETLIPSVKPDLSPWQERIFILMATNATTATEFFRIPPNRVVELGSQLEI
ncbi:potassium transporter Kup [Skermanella stibiiresistens]|nr:potassium transporter Kup [Skermanella stibiiresistens]